MEKIRKDEIIKKLKESNVILPCPRCGNENFTLLDGYFNQTIQTDLSKGIVIGGNSVPSIIVVCTKCGYMSQHALGVLESLKTEESKNE